MKKFGWDYDCAVIGGGPGGLVASLYLRRYERSVVLINHGRPRASWIPRTHNLMGFPHGITGKELLNKLNRQVSSLHCDRLHGQACVRRDRGGFVVELKGERLRVKKVVLAVGIEDIQPDISNLALLREKGLLRYCPICDAYEFRQQDLIVLAQDDKGIRSGLFMSSFTGKIRLILPETLKVKPERVAQIKKAKIRVTRGRVLCMSPCTSPKGLRVELNGKRSLVCHAAYVELGSQVHAEAFKGMKNLNRDENGRIITNSNQLTSIPGLFAVGDCVHQISQISIAAAHGAIAATTIHQELRDKSWVFLKREN